MHADDKTIAYQFHVILNQCSYNLSLWTILRCRTSLGWTFWESAYCQLIREAKKQKWLDWVKHYKHEADTVFLDVVWSDKCSVQLETRRRFSCHKWGERPKNKPRYYPCVCVCACMIHSYFFLIERSIQLRFLRAGISLRGPTGICIFEGTMNADLFTRILDQTLLPFLQDGFLDSHCFMQENNLKHTSVQQKIFWSLMISTDGKLLLIH